MITHPDRDLIAAVLGLLCPADGRPPAAQTAVLEWLDARAAGPHERLWATVLTPGFTALGAEHGPDAALLAELEHQSRRPGWPVPPQRFIRELVTLAGQAYYGTRDSPAWQAVGYQPGGKRQPDAPVVHVQLDQVRLAEAAGSYDVIVVGAGAGGGVAARVLAGAGARVLLLDRGRYLPYSAVSRDHLANHRLPAYGHNTGPEPGGNPRVIQRPGEAETVIEQSFDPRWSNTAMTVGGGTRVYQGMAWRFHPDDFRLATRYGVPGGSSLADWPLTYDELEPHYTRAEQELGVCGDGGAHGRQGHRSAGYPLPPLPDNLEASVLRAGARVLGLATGPVPLAINSVARDGRAACVRCGECVGFACPVDAKNGTHNTVIARALATGRCTLATGARVQRVLLGARGRAAGVAVVDVATGASKEISAGAVVLAAGAIETARLLLASATDDFPRGLGNQADMVGRNLQGHVYVGAFGLFSDLVQDMEGPGVSIATADYLHNLGADGIGGGVLANEVIKTPVAFWGSALPPGAPRWGRAGVAAMRQAHLRTSHLNGPIQEIPNPGSRVTLADARDAHGDRVARLAGAIHPESARAARALRARAQVWMRASGAREVWSSEVPAGLSAGQHQAGTARMGDDPARSVTDPFGRVHGHDGLWVMDASLHVSNGGVNPVLTILALAYRNAEKLAQEGSR
ncbi:MAG TPA: GMC family oxidoreductase [Trebonia sp.]|nr:GMC family oxidoreductase [Trebonia sp.]